MRAVREGQAPVGSAVQAEGVRLVEGPLVPVGGGVPQGHHVPGPDVMAVQRQVLPGGAARVQRRRGPAQHLLDRRPGGDVTGLVRGPLRRVVQEGGDPADQGEAGGLVAAEDQAVAVEDHLLAAQGCALDPYPGEEADDVVPRIDTTLGREVAEVQQDLAPGDPGVLPQSVLAVRAERRRCHVQQPPTVTRRYVQQVADRPQRQLPRHVFDFLH
ncbi:hypothetical protein GCM10010219_65200 [Streptomyces netropsis]|nr:hypothetical protein GCM10010219_65200 [Streptomyces netropsis]